MCKRVKDAAGGRTYALGEVRSILSVLRLLVLWDRIRGSFWFMPAVMTAAAIALSWGVTRLDQALGERVYSGVAVLQLFGAEGARAILSAIASSMITVAALTFSITMLTLQLASSQFGPRLLRNFMRDRGNQLVLGTFISTFLYCLLVLRTVKGVEGASFVPHLAVAIGVLLAVASLAVLIFFIHHTAHSIRIETQLAVLAAETASTIDRLYPERLGQPPSTTGRPLPDNDNVEEDDDALAKEARAGFESAEAIAPDHGGYVQMIDGETLIAEAARRDLVVWIAAPPGAFVTERDALLLIRPAQASAGELSEEARNALRAAVVIGEERTPEQDLAFSVRRIVEIAQRSLSPGINDPTTALYCIDRLGQAFVRLADRKPPASRRFDEAGRLRVLARPVTFETLTCDAFAAVARYAGQDTDVLRCLAEALDRVAAATDMSRHPRLAALRLAVRSRADGGMPQAD